MGERPEEAAARKVVEAHTGWALRYVDTDGRVDYEIDVDGRLLGAMEVSRYTSHGGRRGAAQSATEPVFESDRLAFSWTVGVQGDPDFRGLGAKIEPLLLVVEEFGLDEFQIGWSWPVIMSDPRLRQALRALGAFGVTGGYHFRTNQELSDAGRTVLNVSRQGAYVSAGSNEAVREIAAYVRGVPDNLRKLRNSGLAVRHLFLWVDFETAGSAQRPFQGGRADEWEHFGLPTAVPELPDEVTHLWVVYEPTKQGWYWDGTRWSPVG